MIPPFELRHKENYNISPLNFECLATILSKRSDCLSGANPNIPLASCDKNRLVSLVVHPITVLNLSYSINLE